jgi:hypothetical protein
MSSWWRQRTPLVILGIWTLLGVLESSKAYVSDQLRGIPRGWGPALVGNMPWWWCWALLTPVVFRLAPRCAWTMSRGSARCTLGTAETTRRRWPTDRSSGSAGTIATHCSGP